MGNVVKVIDWASMGDGLVVDVGGSFGHAAFAIAEVSPKLRFIVQDLEKVINQAKKERRSDKYADRVDFQVHSFFNPQPVRAADVYFLRYICHDYSDKYAAKILSHIADAMGKGSKIVIHDQVVPNPGVLSIIEEQRAR
jgi:SAM-dependent methyltransferase